MKSTPKTLRFYTDLAATFDRLGELRLSALYFDGSAVAVDYEILHANRLYCLKNGYAEEFSKFSPGDLLRMEIVKKCHEMEIDSFELLAGGENSPAKRFFATGTCETGIVRACGHGPAPALRMVAVRAALKGRGFVAEHPRLQSRYDSARRRYIAWRNR